MVTSGCPENRIADIVACYDYVGQAGSRWCLVSVNSSTRKHMNEKKKTEECEKYQYGSYRPIKKASNKSKG